MNYKLGGITSAVIVPGVNVIEFPENHDAGGLPSISSDTGSISDRSEAEDEESDMTYAFRSGGPSKEARGNT